MRVNLRWRSGHRADRPRLAAARQRPDRVNMRGRDHGSQRSEVGENQSRKGPEESRSPVRSAGLACFKRRPSRTDDRWLLVILKLPRDQEPNVSIVPGGTDISLLHHFPALRTGLLSLSPSGTSLQRILLTPYVDADGQLPDRRITGNPPPHLAECFCL